MPRAKFKPLDLASLPRVFVAILAMNDEDRGIIAEAIAENSELTRPLAEAFKQRPDRAVFNVDNLAKLFDAILQLPKGVREMFVVRFNELLDVLIDHRADNRYDSDLILRSSPWDPRGSHRDLDVN